MKRSFISGAQKRKRAVEEKEIIMKLPKLTSWLNPGAASATSTVPPNIASTSTSTSIPTSNHPPPDTSVPVPDAGDIPQEHTQKYVTAEECAIKVTDPGLWDIKNTSTVDYWIRNGPTSCQNHDCNLSNSRRVYDQVGGREDTRYLSKHLFKRELRNGECVKREWLLYSPSQGCLYCFACRFLSKKEASFVPVELNSSSYSRPNNRLQS